MTLWLAGRSAYFVTFREAASSVKGMYDAAHVWMLVKSQVVAPSGLFPSVRRRPGGSLELGISAIIIIF